MAEQEITLKNGVWIHETEWAAIKELIRAVDAWTDEDRTASGNASAAVLDAFVTWRTCHLDIAEETRAIQSLTQIVVDLSESVPDDVPSSRMA